MRLINADKLMSDIEHYHLSEGKFQHWVEIQPTIEPERKKGKWVWSDEDASWKCSSCDCVFNEFDWKPEYNYCPNCGANMRGKEDE